MKTNRDMIQHLIATDTSLIKPTHAAGATVKVVINCCFGGFGISDAAYEKLIEWGIPSRRYTDQPRNLDTGLYEKLPLNDGEVIFDREMTPEGENDLNDHYYKYRSSGTMQRYWDCWLDKKRTHPLLIRLVEELGDAASNRYSDLKVVEVPAGTKWHISEYDGNEHIAEDHRTWD